MKSLQRLEQKISKDFDVQFSEFPGPLSPNEYYIPKILDNEDSKRFWIRFNVTETESYAIFGDFKDEIQKRYPIKSALPSLVFSERKDISDVDYKKERVKWRKEANKKLDLAKEDYHPYFDPVKVKGFKQKIKGKVALIPYYSITSRKLESLLQINEKGGKFALKGSQPQRSIHFLQLPKATKKVYVCEGIKTAYAILKAMSEEVGIISVGSISNIDATLDRFKDEYELIVCTEKGSHAKYLDLKHKHKVKIVGSPEYDDIADFLEKNGEKKTEHLLNTFKSSLFVPLGLSPSGTGLRFYIKQSGEVLEYKKTDSSNLFVDCHNTNEAPSKEACEAFYFEQRCIARDMPARPKNAEVSTGIFKRGKRFYFYDGIRSYLMSDDDIVRVDTEDLISPETLFRKDPRSKKDLSKFENITFEEVLKILESFRKICTFDNPMDHKLCIGWIIQAMLCGGIPFRSHLWINGDFSSGKSTFVTEFICELLTFYEKKIGRETTAKWVERAFNKKAIPFYHDEFEPSKSKTNDSNNMLELHRVTATERYASVGKARGADEATLDFTFCYSAIITSIETLNELKNEDISRFTFLKLKQNFMSRFTYFITAYQNWVRDNDINLKILAAALRGHQKFLNEYKTLVSKLSESKISMHKVRSFSNLVAGFNLISPDEEKITYEEALEYIERFKLNLEHVSVSFFEGVMNSLVSRNFFGGFSDRYLKDMLKNVEERSSLTDYMFVKAEGDNHFLYVYHSALPFIQDILKKNMGYLKMDAIRFKIAGDEKYLVKKNARPGTSGNRRRCYKFDIGKFWDTL